MASSLHVPVKVSSPTGHLTTICILDDDNQTMLNTIDGLGPLLDLDQHFSLIRVRENNEEKLVVIRTLKPYTSAPSLNFLFYLTEVLRMYNRILRRVAYDFASLRPAKILNDIAGQCIVRTGFFDLTLKIKLYSCVKGICSKYWKLWNRILEEYSESETRPSRNPCEEARNEYERIRVLLLLKRLIAISVFIRRFKLIYSSRKGLETHGFDLKYALTKIYRRDENLRDIVTLFLLNHCCYSGIFQYPLLIWYAQVYGVDLPPVTVTIFRPRGVRDIDLPSPRGLPMPLTTRDQEEYGEHAPWTLERYVRRWDLDSIGTAAAIDLYSTRALMNPWPRSVVYTSLLREAREAFGRELVPKCDDPLVIPVLFPRKAVDPKVNMIPIPLISTYILDAKTRTVAEEVLQRLNLTSASDIEIKNAAYHVMRILEENLTKIESVATKKVTNQLEKKNLLLGTRNSCVAGIIVEALHPFASFFLSEEVIERNVADIPSPSRKVNLLYRLMERLTEASSVEVAYYLVVRAGSLIKDYKKYVSKNRDTAPSGAPAHSFALRKDNELIIIPSFNIEKILKIVLDIEEENSNFEEYSCLHEVAQLNHTLWDAVE